MIEDRLDLVVLARLATAERPTAAMVAGATQRFAPTTMDRAAWTQTVEAAIERLAPRDPEAELARRLAPTTWKRLSDHLLPGLALGLAPNDKALPASGWSRSVDRRHRRSRTRALDHRLSALAVGRLRCVRVANASALPGRPKRCPPEVRALFLQRELRS